MLPHTGLPLLITTKLLLCRRTKYEHDVVGKCPKPARLKLLAVGSSPSPSQLVTLRRLEMKDVRVGFWPATFKNSG